MTVELRGVCLSLTGLALEVDIEIARGWTGLFGPSGAGKTSLLETIAGFRRPESGSLRIDGETVFDARTGLDAPPRARGVGYVTQDETLFPQFSVRGNLAYGARRAGTVSPGFGRVVDLLGLGPLVDRSVTNLSGGEKRRVALARALLSGPRLLLLDEPLTGLDSPLRDQVIASLKAIHAQFPVRTIYVAHNPEEVLALCDEVLVLERGRVRRRAAPRELFSSRVLSEPAEST